MIDIKLFILKYCIDWEISSWNYLNNLKMQWYLKSWVAFNLLSPRDSEIAVGGTQVDHQAEDHAGQPR